MALSGKQVPKVGTLGFLQQHAKGPRKEAVPLLSTSLLSFLVSFVAVWLVMHEVTPLPNLVTTQTELQYARAGGGEQG